MTDERDTETTRRTFMKGVGLAAGAATLGLSETGTASAAHGFDTKFANWRVREASKVWQRGYTGHPKRAIAITDSGVEARHPDLGPWNGVKAEIDADEGFQLVDPTGAGEMQRTNKLDDSYSGTVTPGGPAPANNESYHEFVGPAREKVEATLSWSPENQEDPVLGTGVGQDLEFRLDRQVDGGWEQVGRAATANNPEVLLESISEGTRYRFAVETYAYVAPLGYDIDVTFFDVETTSGSIEQIPLSQAEEAIFGDIDGTVDATTPKTVGWYDAGTRYGSLDEPRDPDGHGSHCSSIMAGSGRASRVDPDRYEEGDTGTLLPTDVPYSIEVEVDADGGVFGAAYGDGIELFIEDHTEETIETGGLGADTSLFDNTLIDHPAVHDEGTETYTVYVRPYQPEGAASTQVGRVQEFVAGAMLPEENEGSREGIPSLHAGMSPNAPIVGLQGLGTPTTDFGAYADEFAETFNIRTVNMSWGYLGGAPLGGAGGVLDQTPKAIRQIAEAGVLTCAAAGNTATPANGNGAPAVADEAISVVSCDPVDGLVSYSSGGIGGLDEDEQKVDMKPDVSAPGGAADGYPGTGYDLVRAALAAAPSDDESDVRIRDYTLKAGTSMASPYVTGTAGLVAEAMEFGAPESIRLPSPKELHADGVTAEDRLAETLRLKSVILSTASQTAFTAAPFHHPTHRPDYRHGERDPFEGYGRVNPDAAVDAVSRPLVDTSGLSPEEGVSATHEEVVGLNVPDDSRAVAGYVEVGDGSLTADIAFSHYGGGNKGMALETPHLDLFVYDAETPGTNGEPNIVASAMGMQGTAEISIDAPETDTVYVVAKLVNIPGAVNTNDVRAHFDLTLDYTAPALPAFSVGGSRSDDGSAFTQGSTNQVKVTVSDLPSGVDAVSVTDSVPEGWTVKSYGDAQNSGDVREVTLGTVSRDDLGTEAATKTYFVEATGGSGQYDFGPAEATIVEGDSSTFRNTTAEFGGTDTNTIVGADQNQASL